MGCIPSKTANSDVEANVTRGQVRAQQHPQHTINTSPPLRPGGEKTDTSNLPTKHVDQRMSPTPPSSAFSTPGRVLGGASPEPMRDAYTGQRIYSPTDPNHPSRRPISSAFKKKYKRYYDEASPQMPQHLFWD